MSNDWGYRCTQDGECSGKWFNHGQDRLRAAAKVWPLAEQLLTLQSQDFDVDVYIRFSLSDGYYESEVWNFLREHHAHGLELISEYGDTEPLESE